MYIYMYLHISLSLYLSLSLYIYIYIYMYIYTYIGAGLQAHPPGQGGDRRGPAEWPCEDLHRFADALRGSSVRLGTMQRILAWPLRKDDMHTSRSVNEIHCFALR